MGSSHGRHGSALGQHVPCEETRALPQELSEAPPERSVAAGMAHKQAVNGHATPTAHPEDIPGGSHFHQVMQPGKQGQTDVEPHSVREAQPGTGTIAGVYVEASKKTMSFYDATREHFLMSEPALALLEAQAATGFLIDPVGNKQLSVAEAVRLGLVGLELKEKLLSAERAATGFMDPYTDEKISLYQAIQKELLGREQGARLLEVQIATGGLVDPVTSHRVPMEVTYEQGHFGDEMSQLLSDPSSAAARGFLDPNTSERVTYRELKKRCIIDPTTGLLLLPLKITFPGLRGRVSSSELLSSSIIDMETFRALQEGRVSVQEVAEMDHVKQYLEGTGSIAGVAVLPTGERKSLYQALTEHLLMPGTALALLQAQAATACLTEPTKTQRLSADDAVKAGVVGPELYEKLSSAERAATGYRDPCTGELLSLFQAMSKGLVARDQGTYLLEAQLATGGLIDPVHNHRVPVEMACQRGYLDEDMKQLLFHPTHDIKGFFDPNTKETLMYAELLERCVTDPDTGLCLLPLFGDDGEGSRGVQSFIDHRTRMALENTTVPVACGKFKGKSVSLWKLLFSDYFTSEQRATLTQQCLTATLSMQELAKTVSTAVQQMASTANITFEGLRHKVTPSQLLSAEIINRDLFEKLSQGETSAREVVGMDTVRKYLEGTGSISGLLLPDSQEKISIYQAKRKGLLMPGTSLILLEAQAATGFIIDPAANKKYSVEEALRANIIGPDIYNKLLAAEKAVTGYKDPYTGNKISLFQAMSKGHIVKDHGIRLLEAQIATGGIIDPMHSHRIPVEVAYKRGYFDKKMNLILSDPSDDTKGFFDPNTHENLTYLQLKEKCITEPSTGLCLLPLNSKKRQFIDDTTKQAFRSTWLLVKYGRFRGERVSVWDLLNSEYFSEGKRREIFNHYQLRKLTLEQIRLMLEEEMKKWAHIKFPAMRGSVTAYHLLETGIIDKALFERVLEGAVSPEDVLRMDSVHKYLYGSGSIGGIVLQPSNQRMSIYEAMKQKIVMPGVALPLLEAQAATGFVIDPVNNQKLCVDEAVREGVIGPELHEKLQHAEGAVMGYKDPFTGEKISIFQAMKKGLITNKQAVQLMEAQIATGGIIDPHRGHYVPVEFAQKQGYLDEDMSKTLSSASDNTRVYCVPNSKEPVTYAQLIARCQKDKNSGLHLLPLPQTAMPVRTDEQIQQLFKETMVKEKGVSLWELIHSGYFTEEQRNDFVEKYRSEDVSVWQLVTLVLKLVEEIEMKAHTHITFEGLRGSVPAVWLLDAGIITEKTFEDLAQGTRTAREVGEMESVKRYLQGTGSIAGIFIQASKKRMSIYQAMKNNLLLPGTGVLLLEAQAATGAVIDPVTNQKLGVEEAVKAAIVGEELMEKLLLAERAVTGYTDPYTGNSISVCQAIRKGLIPMSDGVRLIEAQLATGGVIDPIHHHHLPLPAAYMHGFYDEEMNQALSQPTDNTKVFFDPNTKENLTYQQLKDRCVPDAGTDLWLLPLSETAAFYVDKQTMEVLKSVTVCVAVGRFKGQTVSVWDLLNSEYITDCKQRELVELYKQENAVALQEIITTVTTIIEETEKQGKRFTFKGLRKQVSASDLFQSQLIDKKTLDELKQGQKTVKEVTEMDSVRRYLEGGNFIAGVLVQPANEKMSIYQAMTRGMLRPGTALVLLEAQAATGFVIDPVKNKRLSVEEALAAGLIGQQVYEKLLSAERAVTGYTDPCTKGQISLFEAMNQGLILKSHGIRLLEAQIATGGIIDPVHSHRLPVEVAYKRGYFDEEMNRILSDPSDDTKGFFDPNTQENLTYMQLLERCVQDPETGLYMLQIVKHGGTYFYIDESMKQFLHSKPIKMQVGKFKGQTVSLWDLLCSQYISEQKRKELVKQYKCETLTIEQLITVITTIIEEMELRTQALQVKGLRGHVSVSELFNAEIIDKTTLDNLQKGTLTVHKLTQMDSVKRYLEGTGGIAGVLLPAKKEKMSIYHALERGFLKPESALVLLEAQAASGFITDPLKNEKLSVDEAVSTGLVGREIHEKLLSAERAVTGYTDPYTGNKISLFQAMKRDLIVKDHGIPLLEAQIATGGIIDPVHSHRLPVEVAYKRGYLDDDTFLLLSDPEHGNRRFMDPNTHEKLSYAQLLQRCSKDPDTGLCLLQITEKKEDYFYIDEQTKNTMLLTMVQVPVRKYEGHTPSLWELLCSDYISEEQRKELVKQYKKECTAILQKITDTILTIIHEKERSRQDIWFQGIRQQVTASELFNAQIITKDTMVNLDEGKQTAKDIAKMDSVKRYLEGTSCIAGVLVPSNTDPSKTEKMSIYQAMGKGILRPGTALVLLEAQAASGFITDPLKNEKLSVDEAVSAGLVGREIHEKLLSAERAVTGYTDPYTGNKISLFQAMKRDLIVKDHGIRLLEAQIATGGIIDPVHSHRLPVEVAYKRGYFDEEMNRILSHPSDDTKGFFDPNTHENLTYMQLLSRCVPDPDTGLLMLQLMHKGSVLFQLDEKTRISLQSAPASVSVGLFQGQNVTVWELLFSRYVPDQKRQELLRKYKAGTLTIQEMTTIITALITEAEQKSSREPRHVKSPSTQRATSQNAEAARSQRDEKREKALKTTTVDGPGGEFQGRKVSVWDLLFSKYVLEEKRQELLKKYKAGTLTIQEMITVVTTLITEREKKSGQQPGGVEGPCREERTSGRAASAPSPQDQQAEKTLRLATVDVSVGEFQGRKVSVWELLFSKYLSEEKRQELLEQYRAGTVTLEELVRILTTIVEETEERSSKVKFSGLRRQVTASELFSSDIIDQNTLTELTQGTKTVQEITEMDSVKRYLEGTSCIAGVLVPSNTDPSKTEKMSIYQAMGKGILRPGTALVLLEAQAASGFITDPLKNEKLSVDEAVSAGLVGREIHEKLLSAERAVTGYTDPYTGNKISLFQAMKRDLIVKDHGIRLLEAQIATGGIIDPVHSHRLPVEMAYKRGYFDEEMNRILSDPSDDTKGFFDPNTHENLTYMQLLSRCVPDPDTGLLMLQLMHKGSVLFQLDEKTRISLQSAPASVSVGLFQGQNVTVWELLFSRYVPDQKRQELLRKYKAGTLTIQEMTTIITALITEAEQKSSREPRHVKSPSTQRATSQNAEAARSQRDEKREKALKTTTVDGPGGEFQGRKVSVWDLLFSKYVLEEKRQELLKKYKAGTLTIQEMITVVTTLITEREKKSGQQPGGVEGPCREERTSGRAASAPSPQDQQAEKTLRLATVDVSVGEFQGRKVSVWELLFSKYLSEEKRQELLEQYRAGTVTLEELVRILTTIVEETEERSSKVKFSGLRRQVTASELFSSDIIDQNTLTELTQGTKTVQEITEMDSVKRYLEGTSCIAGVLVPSNTDPSKTEKMSIYQAMGKGILRPGTALVLLEAQAASGFITDPLKNEKLSVDEAVSAGLVGREIHEKLLSAERAVTGYTDPYTGNKISLFQAMKRDLIVKDHGIRLLEAQIATGGIIDPVHSHRLPVEVAYKRGYFDEEMNRILSDPSDDTKGFFDPNTHENLTYMQLLSRCVPDPDTGLLMLQLMHKGSVLFQLDEKTRISLQSAPASVSVGLFQGQNVTVWELLFSRYVPDQKRQELLRKYKAGTLTIQEMTTIITALITEAEQKSSREPRHVKSPSTQRATSQNAEAARSQRDEKREKALKTTTVDGPGGEFQGRKVSVWDLLFSKYVLEEKRQELLKKYKAGTLTIQEMITVVTTLITEREKKSGQQPGGVEGPCREERTSGRAASAPSPQDQQAEKTLRLATVDVSVGEFQGRKVSVWELLFSKYLSEEKRQELLEQYRAGTVTLEELVRILTTIVEETEERSSKVKFSGLRRQVTASELFSSDIIDQNTLTELTQGTKTVQEITEMDSVKRYLEGTSCIAGVLVPSNTDPSKTEKMSIYQAMGKGILRPGTALVLLEAQAASGFITDPLKNEKLSVDEAVSAGLVGREIHEKLLSAERAVTGYTDPYTGNKISLFQAMKRDLIVKDHGIRLLEAQIATGGIIDPVHSHRLPVEVAYKRGYFDEEMNRILSDPSDDTKGFFDPNTHENLTYMQLLSRCVPDPDTGLLMLQLMHKGSVLFQLDEKTRISLQSAPASVSVGLFQGQNVTVWELLFSRYVPDQKRQELLRKYKAGTLTIQEMTTIITALITEAEQKSSREPRHVKSPSTQRATSQNAEAARSQRDEKREKALKTTTVDGPGGEFQGRKVSVWDLLFSKYVLEEKRQELLKKYKAGTLTIQEMITVVTTLITEREKKSGQQPGGVEGPCREERTSGRAASAPSPQDQQAEKTLRLATVDVSVGEFQGRKVSVWELLFSKYLSEEKRQELLEQYRAGTVTLEELVRILTTIVEETEERSSKVKFSGLRRQVTASELFSSDIIDQNTLTELTQGTKTVQEITEMDSVKRYLEGTSCIAGVLVPSNTDPSKTEKMSIYQAMGKGILRPGTALVLLEAQAASGFITDPLKNEKLSVDEAVSAGLVGREIHEKLLSAERAVTGYTDPYTGNKISLFQAMKRDLIVKDHGIRLLEAQIATGGIIDPVHSHRLPVEVAYKRGYFDEEMNRILSDPSDDTKGFFDPNTHENLTYMQLLSRCVPDPDTGLLMLQLMHKGSVLFQLDEKTRISLQSAPASVSVGLFQGQNVTVWELLFSRYVPDQKRQELLRKYKAGTLTIQEMTTIITALITEAEQKSSREPRHVKSPSTQRATSQNAEAARSQRDEKREKALKTTTVDGPGGEFQGRKVSVWDLLFSKYVLEEKRQELLKKYKAGTLTIQEMITVVTTLITEREKKSGQQPGGVEGPCREERTSGRAASAPSPQDQQAEKTLRLATVDVSVGEFQGRKVSVWELLFSKYLSEEKRQELLEQYRAGTVTLEELVRILTTIVEETEERSSKVKFSGLRRQVTASELFSSDIIDQNTLTELTQGTKTVQEITEMDSVKRYLEGTSCIAGVLVPSNTDPSKTEKMSIYQAMGKGILRPGTALVLLEAQAASGFITDPLKNEKLSVDEAVSAGLVGREIHEKLLSAERAVTGYTDPYTGNKISLFQAMKRDLIVKDHGIRLLEAQIATGGIIDPVHSHRLPVEVAYKRGYFDEEMNRILSDPSDDTKGFFDPNTHENLTYMQLLSRCVPDPDTGLLMLQLMHKGSVLFQLDEKTRISLQSAPASVSVGLFQGQNVTVWELLFSRYVPDQKRQELLRKYKAGTLTIQEMTTIITALITEAEQKSSREPRHVKSPSTQRATSQNAEAARSQRDEKREKALKTTTVDGPGGEFQGRKVSVWDLLFSKYVLEEKRQELLKKYKAGTLTIQEMITVVTTLITEREKKSGQQPGGVEGPCREERTSGRAASAPSPQDQQAEKTLRLATVDVSVGEFQGRKVSVWELLFSKYLSEEKRQELLEQYRAGTVTLEELVRILTTIVEETEERSSKVKFSGLRRQVTASELFSSDIIDQNTLTELTQGTKTVQEITEMDSVKRYLEGTSCIAGVLVPSNTDPSKTEKMSIYQAMGKGILRPGTALVLLEAQAASGFITDPLKNEKLSVDEAVSAGLVGREIHEKLLSAERAVTGYTDPYTGNKISLFQAMKRDLIVKDHGIRLLEAQIATGGIIDPVHSHRLPVEVAYKRGYFDEEMNRILSDPSDDTKGFFDPNTHENLTYMQLLSRCVPDPDTGLLMLQLMHKGSVLFQLDEKTRISLQSAPASVSVGLFQGQNVTVWELLFSRYVPDQKRQELLRKYKAGTLTIQEMTTIITALITEAEQKSSREPRHVKSPSTQRATSQNAEAARSQRDEKREKALKTTTVDGPGGEFQGRKVSVWDLLFSKYVLEEKRQELLKKYKAGTLTIQEMITVVTTLITEREKKSGQQPGGVEGPCREERTSGRAASAPSPQDQQAEKTLRLATVDVSVGEFQGRKVSVWELLFSKYLSEEKRQELLEQYRAGTVTLEELVRILTTIVEETEERSSKVKFSGLRRQVTASELFSSDIIDQNTLTELTQGTKTVQEITEMDSVKRYLEGTSCIAGVLVPSNTDPSKTEKMSIYQAMGKGILRPGTALVLLEAQAASGFITDPLKNEKLSVDEAVSAGLVGREIHEKLLSAERAVTGYTDPYTGNKISLFQAMKRDLIVKDHGIRLLEAQIATGGIIDPVHSHRLPVEVAYKRGYFDEEMNRILSDPSDDTKGFFDPNTHENLTYMQLLSRCVPDPDTGLLMLQLMHKGSVLFQLDEKTRISLQSAPASVSVGLFQGQNVTVWELLFSRYVPDQKRQELLRKYKAGTLTIQEMTTIITALITEAEQKSSREPRHVKSPSTQRATSQNAEAARSQRDEKREKALKTTTVDGPGGEFQGRKVSVWDLLFSKYVLEEKRQELLKKYKAGTLTIQEMITVVTTLITEREKKSGQQPGGVEGPCREERTSGRAASAPSPQDQQAEKTLRLATVDVSVGEFQGRKVSVWELLFSKYLSEEKRQELLEQYRAGTVTLEELVRILTTIVEETEERSSKVKFSGLRRQVTASELFSSDIIDQNTLTELTQGTKTVQEITEMDSVKRYLEGTSCIAGVLVPSNTDPSKTEKMSIYQAMGKGILRPGTALVLLEAQAASGFITDPLKNEKLSVDEAVSAGLVGREIHEKLLSAERAVTGYTDPYTGNKISLFQAMKRDLIVKDHGIRLLEAQIATGGIIDPVHSHRLPVEVAYKRGYFDEEMNRILSDPSDDTKGFFDPNTHENLTYMQLLSRCVPDPDTGLLMLQLMHKGSVLFQLDEKTRISLQSAPASVSVGLFQGQNVTVWELLFSRYVPDQKRQELLRKYKAGTLTIQEMTTIITALITEAEQKSSREPRHVKSPSTQRATSQNAEAARSQRDEKREKALKTTTVDGPGGEFQGRKVSVWDLLFSKYVLEEKRQELLKKYKAGTLTIQEMITVVTTLITEREKKSGQQPGGVEGPCREERTSGRAASAPSPQDQQAEKTLRLATVDVSVGEFQGRKVSVWELLFSKYLSEEKRQELLEQYRAGTVTLEELVRILTTIVEETEERSSKVKFSGLRRQVTASELFSSDIIDQNTLTELTQGTKTVQEITEMDSVKRYLEGTSCIAGVLVPSNTDPSKTEKMSIYQAMGKGILRPGTALVLLEAQAASGFITDPLKNEKLSVDEAVSAGLVGREIHEKLLSAERAVTGYTDPYTGNKISLFQAMKRDLIVKDHGIRLLEAQIATGGIIDPVHSHRLPVEVAYKRGYFDEEMNRILSDPSDDTKGFFDPNTHENLTYMQLLSRCVPDPDTGLLMLQLMHKGSVLFQLDEKTRISLQSAPASVSVGLFQGQNVTVWELLFSRYVPDQKRQELLRKYKAGTLTIQEMTTIITALITEAEQKSSREPRHVKSPSTQRATSQNAEAARSQRDEKREKALKTTTVDGPGGEFQGRKVSVWDLLFSKYVLEEKRQELLKKYKAGTLTIQEMITVVTTLITEREKKSGQQPGGVEGPCREERTSGRAASAPSPQDQQAEKTLRLATVDVSVGEFQGRKVSVWELLFSKYLSEEKRQELLEQYRAGTVTLEELVRILTTIVEETEERSSKVKFSGLRRQVTASELFSSDIIDQNTLTELTQGTKTVQEITEMDSVKRYLEGTSCIAGVLVPSNTDPSKTEKMSIYQAMGKGILRPGTALVLLEAQAASGFITDPLKNEKLSVDEAVSAGLVGREIHEKLLSAERAVTGYTDPYTGNKISLFQAMKRDLIVKDHGIRLLEAQIATGGIIDPVHSHRLPVEVAYKRGYFDEEMNRILSDPSDDTKGFFDPNTHENLTYMQLLSRCIPDPDTGLCLLKVGMD
ncbi:epiplakin [Mauremys mutica]|uniref:epiplakin n=1 Tax=Mauremys mutica TaxID=74926 RepID=UPI001D15FC45|nr:epiplakin [Mauremys mutica]